MNCCDYNPPPDLVIEDDNAGDESVISEYSTSHDSNVTSAPALEDVDSYSTPVGSDDEGLIITDELLEQMEKLDLLKDDS